MYTAEGGGEEEVVIEEAVSHTARRAALAVGHQLEVQSGDLWYPARTWLRGEDPLCKLQFSA